MKRNIEVVEKLANGNSIIKVEEINRRIKYAIANEGGIINISDLNGNISGIIFFDKYRLNEFGDIIIGVEKDCEEYIQRVLSHYDLSDTQYQELEKTGGPFNIAPGSRLYCDIIYPTKTIDDIVPQSYRYNYGLINRNGFLSIYPEYDDMQFGNEDTCIVGNLSSVNLKFGYIDILTGNLITPVCFKEARSFNCNRAVVKYNRMYGYLDRNKIMEDPKEIGEYADNLEPKFFSASDFENDEAEVCIMPANHLSKSVKVVINPEGILRIQSLVRTRINKDIAI